MADSYSLLGKSGNEKLTLEQLKRKRALADALMAKGFHQTQVGPGGSYTPFAGLADALSSALGQYTGAKQNKALDAREAELAAIEQAKQDTHANLFNAMRGGQTLAEPTPPNVGPVPIPDPAGQPLAPEQPAEQPVGPQQPDPPPQALAGALEKVIGQAPGATQSIPATPAPSPAAKAVAQAMGAPSGRQGLTPVPLSQWGGRPPPILQTKIPYGEYSHTKRITPDGYPLASDYVRDEREQAALAGMDPEQQDQFLTNEEEARTSGHPDYGPDMVPPGPPIPFKEGEIPVMPEMSVTGMRPKGSQFVPQPVPLPDEPPIRETRAPPPPPPQPALLAALMSQQPGATPQQSLGLPAGPAPAPAAPTGPAAAPELVQALMQKSGLAMPGPMAAAPAPTPVARPSQPQGDDRWIRLWKSSVAVGDKEGMKFALERMAPEEKLYVVKGALVDSMGKSRYNAPAGAEDTEKHGPGTYAVGPGGVTQYYPKLADNMEYIDSNDRAKGTRMIPNAAEINARTKGMETGAETQAKAEVESQFKIIPVPDGQGGTKLMTEAQYLKTQKGNTPAATAAPDTIDYTDSKGTRIEFQGSLDELRRAAESTGRADYKAAVNEYEQSLKGGTTGVTPGSLGHTPSAARLESDKLDVKRYSERYDQTLEAGKRARDSQANLTLLKKAYDNPDVASGSLAGVVTYAKGVAGSLGLNIKGKSDEDVVTAVTNHMVLKLRATGSGEGLPGAASDKDIVFLKGGVPGLEKSPEGRKKLIEIYSIMNQREIDVQSRAIAYKQKHGVLDTGFDKELQDFADKHPLFEKFQLHDKRPPLDSFFN